MDEFVFVVYPSTRGVVIDDNPSGQTNTLLRVSRGLHTFALAGDEDYQPGEQRLRVANTSMEDPKIVEFAALAG